MPASARVVQHNGDRDERKLRALKNDLKTAQWTLDRALKVKEDAFDRTRRAQEKFDRAQDALDAFLDKA